MTTTPAPPRGPAVPGRDAGRGSGEQWIPPAEPTEVSGARS